MCDSTRGRWLLPFEFAGSQVIFSCHIFKPNHFSYVARVVHNSPMRQCEVLSGERDFHDVRVWVRFGRRGAHPLFCDHSLGFNVAMFVLMHCAPAGSKKGSFIFTIVAH